MLILLIVVVFTAKNSWQLRVVAKGRNTGAADKGEEDDRTQQQLWDKRPLFFFSQAHIFFAELFLLKLVRHVYEQLIRRSVFSYTLLR